MKKVKGLSAEQRAEKQALPIVRDVLTFVSEGSFDEAQARINNIPLSLAGAFESVLLRKVKVMQDELKGEQPTADAVWATLTNLVNAELVNRDGDPLISKEVEESLCAGQSVLATPGEEKPLPFEVPEFAVFNV